MNVLEILAIGSSSVLGAIGWVFAWRARGEALDESKAHEKTKLELAATKSTAMDEGRRAAAAEIRARFEAERSAALEAALAAERQTRQSLVDALTKAGVPVGPALVDNALDRLYKDKGGQGGGAVAAGGTPAGVPVTATGSSSPTTRRGQ